MVFISIIDFNGTSFNCEIGINIIVIRNCRFVIVVCLCGSGDSMLSISSMKLSDVIQTSSSQSFLVTDTILSDIYEYIAVSYGLEIFLPDDMSR